MAKVIVGCTRLGHLEGFLVKTFGEPLFDPATNPWPFLTETQARERLAELGITAAAADEHIHHAREHALQYMERLTAPGYRNVHGQQVLRKTPRFGTEPGQRVFILLCGSCGHEYGANGNDIHVRRCPACQGGSPGI